MVRRILVIVSVCFGMMALLQTQAMAWNLGSGGWGYGSYYAFYIITGGQKPGTTTTFVGTTGQVTQAALICVNPGTNKLDVRKGLGGATIQDFGNLGDANQSYDERGKFTFQTASICSKADVTLDNGTVIPGECDLLTFENTWGVDEGDCRNSNWDPYQYLVQKVTITGTILTDCDVPPDPIPPDYQPTNCTSSATASFACETTEDIRNWALDGTVFYTCEKQP
jgi:hypothetical protein